MTNVIHPNILGQAEVMDRTSATLSSEESDTDDLKALAQDRPPSGEEDDCYDKDDSSDISDDSRSDSGEDDEDYGEKRNETDELNNCKKSLSKPDQSNSADETTQLKQFQGEIGNDVINKKKTKKRKTTGNIQHSKGKKARKKNFERRNIRKIRSEEKLESSTRNAQREEEERKRRLVERAQLQTALPNLQPSSAIEKPEPDVVQLSSSDEDDCVVIDHKPPKAEDNDDPENSGIHVNDSLNIPDSAGRVLVNIQHSQCDPDIFLAPQIARAIKPHQIGGIRFLYDNIVESQQMFRNSSGFGCILAHSMGLGKTLQVIGFIDVFMRYTSAKKALIIVPINTLQNWINEFDMWLPSSHNIQGLDHEEITPRCFKLHIINDMHKTVASRAKVIESWTSCGGVLLMGYEMFRLLASRKTKTRKRKPNAPPELIDIDLEEKNDEMKFDMQQALLSPGPDLVICDEGHRIKNSHAGISKSLKQIHTRRRVVLTGYPLQNNLIEYWCMVDFVRPNFLGTRIEFSNMFERPISNGQCVDSTQNDVKLMRYRSHVLHSLLEGFVQRRNHKVLRSNLPPKQEWVIMIRMSQFQRKLYNMFMLDLGNDAESCIGGTNPLKAFAVACKIWNHPDVLHKFLNKQTYNDLDMDVSSPAATGGAALKPIRKSASEPILRLERRNESFCSTLTDKAAEINYDWVKPAFESYDNGVLENSGKFVVLFEIIKQTLALNEKLLIFSQSLTTLDLLEEFFSKMSIPLGWSKTDPWVKHQHYYRLDGSTNASERERLINMFNAVDNREACVFLLSTKVVMLDASWNPCHDCQAVCRVYRYGQELPCFIYRLVTDNTMERKIYDRQITKQSMADRVVDEIQVQNQLTKKENDQLLEYQDIDLPSIEPDDTEKKCSDPVLVQVIRKHFMWITQIPFTHESLLVEQEDQKLTKADKRLAKESYEREKKFNVSFSRQSYASYYRNRTPQTPPVFRGPHLPALPARPTPHISPLASTSSLPRVPISTPVGALNGMREIKPGVSVQIIQVQRDITAPGPEARTIKKGEQVTVIRTPKGTYIKLKDGKIFAVRNRRDAECFGLTDGTQASTSSLSASCNQLSSLLQSGDNSRNFAPNLVTRRHPHTSGNSYPVASIPSPLDMNKSIMSSQYMSNSTVTQDEAVHCTALPSQINDGLASPYGRDYRLTTSYQGHQPMSQALNGSANFSTPGIHHQELSAQQAAWFQNGAPISGVCSVTTLQHSNNIGESAPDGTNSQYDSSFNNG